MGKFDELIQECTQMIAVDGLKSFTLRKLADRVGIKAPSIYEHFKNKEALLDAARQVALTELGHTLTQGCTGKHPRERLITTALGYLRFAEEHQSLFALLFMEMPSNRQGLGEAPKAGSPYAILWMQVKDFLGENHQQAEALSLGIWSLVHGIAMLQHTHLKNFPAPLADGAQINLEALLDGWMARK